MPKKKTVEDEVRNNNLLQGELKDEVSSQWDWFQEKMERVRLAQGIKKQDLGAMLGFQKSRMSQIGNPRKRDLSFTLMMRIIKCLKQNPSEFFSDCPVFFKPKKSKQ
jgi:hypothetical protein